MFRDFPCDALLPVFGRRPQQCGGAFVANRAAVGIGQAKLHRQVIQEESCGKIVEPIGDGIAARNHVIGDCGTEVIHHHIQLHFVVDGLEPGGGRGGFGRSHIILREQALPLEVGWLDEISVDQSKMSDAGPDQMIGHRTAQRTYSSHQHRSGPESFLSFSPNAFEQGLAVVPMHGHGGEPRRWGVKQSPGRQRRPGRCSK